MPAQSAQRQALARFHGAERQVELLGERGLRLVAKVALLDQLVLLARQRRHGTAQRPLQLGQIKTLLGVVVGRHADRITSAPPRSGGGGAIDKAIAGNPEIQVETAARAVSIPGPLPDHQHHSWVNPRQAPFSPETAQVRLDARPKAVK